MFDDLLGTEFDIDVEKISGIVNGDIAAIRGLIVGGLNFIPVVGSVLSAVAALLPFQTATVHLTEAQKVAITDDVVGGYLLQAQQAGVQWHALLDPSISSFLNPNPRRVYHAVVDQIQDVVWPEGLRRWGGGWVRNEPRMRYYDDPTLRPDLERGTSEYGEAVVQFGLSQMILNLTGELDAATMHTQGVTDIAWAMELAIRPLHEAIEAGIITDGATGPLISFDSPEAFVGSPLGMGLLAGAVLATIWLGFRAVKK